MTRFEPVPGAVFVQLFTSDIPAPEKTHDTYISGLVTAVNPLDVETWGYLVGRTAYWEEYKDAVRAPTKQSKLAFVWIKDILGSSYAENDTE